MWLTTAAACLLFSLFGTTAIPSIPITSHTGQITLRHHTGAEVEAEAEAEASRDAGGSCWRGEPGVASGGACGGALQSLWVRDGDGRTVLFADVSVYTRCFIPSSLSLSLSRDPTAGFRCEHEAYRSRSVLAVRPPDSKGSVSALAGWRPGD